LFRGVPETYYDRCIRAEVGGEPIDVGLTKAQHRKYIDALNTQGLNPHFLSADDRYPDCCFVEDPVVLLRDIAVICRLGAKARRGEEKALENFFKEQREIVHIKPLGTLEGGDVLIIKEYLYVGISQRTNREGFEQLQQIADSLGMKAVPVDCRGMVHLKSDCTYLGNNTLVMWRGRFDEQPLEAFSKIIVPDGEAYAANCLSANGTAIVSKGFPRTREMIEDAGFETIGVEMSEFRKGEGALTCLSKVW
jgi:dimethylargininase